MFALVGKVERTKILMHDLDLVVRFGLCGVMFDISQLGPIGQAVLGVPCMGKLVFLSHPWL